MEISLAGIEQAVEGLDYRSDKSPKSRLIHTLKNHYLDSDSAEAVSTLESDALINLMWDLGGDRNAIKSKRKNLSSIKSSVNADLNAAWEFGRNPEGISIGPLNNFVMSDAAKDKILNSFSGAMDLDGGNSLDRVTEALKIVSEYLSNLPGGLEDDKLSNLKGLVEGLAEKFKDGGPGEFEITEKKTDRAAEAGEKADGEAEIDEVAEGDLDDDVELVDEDEILEGADVEEELPEDEVEIDETVEEDEDLDDAEAVIEEEIIEEDSEEIEEAEIDDTEIIEVMDEDDTLDEPDDVELIYEDEILEDADDEEDFFEDETEIEEIDEEDLDDAEALIEDDIIEEDLETPESDETEIIEVMDEDDALDEPDEVELVDKGERLEGPDDEEGLLDYETEIDEVSEGDLDDGEEVFEDEVIDEDLEEIEEPESDETEIIEVMGEDDALDEPDEFEILDEDEILEGDGEDMEALEDDTEIEEVDEVDIDDIDEVLEEDAADLEGDDVVEVMDEADVSELEETELLEDEDVLEEVEGAEDTDAADDTESDDEIQPDDVGLPLDQLSEEALNFEEFEPDEEQKRLLAERFDGYLGAMERYYNQYIIINKGKYTIGANKAEADVLKERKVSVPDYYVGKYPVTNALFEVFIERTGYKTSAEKLGFGYVYHGRFQKSVDPKTGLSRSVWNSSFTREKVDGATWYQPTGPGSTLHQKRNHPVVQVSIKDAQSFAAWTGKRLPTEIEWEAAARTQSGFIFPWGNDWRDSCCNFDNSGISDTCPVDEHPQGINEAGLADLLGNVIEWTADECEPKYPLEKSTRFFIAKGGSWVNHEQTHLFERTRFEAEFTANIVGFRCLAD